jgi:hypothetical protein
MAESPAEDSPGQSEPASAAPGNRTNLTPKP